MLTLKPDGEFLAEILLIFFSPQFWWPIRVEQLLEKALLIVGSRLYPDPVISFRVHIDILEVEEVEMYGCFCLQMHFRHIIELFIYDKSKK